MFWKTDYSTFLYFYKLFLLLVKTDELWKFVKPLPSSISKVKTSVEALEETDTNILEEIENLKGINSVNTENIETTRQVVKVLFFVMSFLGRSNFVKANLFF